MPCTHVNQEVVIAAIAAFRTLVFSYDKLEGAGYRPFDSRDCGKCKTFRDEIYSLLTASSVLVHRATDESVNPSFDVAVRVELNY